MVAIYSPIRTPSDFQRRIEFGKTSESLTLEFKRDLDRWAATSKNERREGQKELCRDVSQFANTYGGCILIGIDETEVNGARVAAGVHPIDNTDSRRIWMEQAIINHLSPSTTPILIVDISTPQGNIIAINVAPSERLVTVWDRESGTIECLRRTNHGKVRMNPDELEGSLMNTRRTAMLALQRVSEEVRGATNNRRVDLASGIWITYMTNEGTIGRQTIPATMLLNRITEYEFELRVHIEGADTRLLRIPYGLLHETWVTSDSQIGIFLSARVVLDDSGRLGLEPFV